MSRLRRLVLAVLLLLLVAPLGSTQERIDREQAKARWKKLPKEERQELLKRYKEFKSLPAEVRERIRKNLSRLERMSPEQRQAFRRKLAAMTPEQRRECLARSTGLAQMPAPKRVFVQAMGWLARSLSAEEQQRIRSLPAGERQAVLRGLLERKFAERFLATEEERAQFHGAPPEARLRKMRQQIVKQLRSGRLPPFDGEIDPDAPDFK